MALILTRKALEGDAPAIVISAQHFSTQKEACRCWLRDGRFVVSR